MAFSARQSGYAGIPVVIHVSRSAFSTPQSSDKLVFRSVFWVKNGRVVSAKACKEIRLILCC